MQESFSFLSCLYGVAIKSNIGANPNNTKEGNILITKKEITEIGIKFISRVEKLDKEWNVEEKHWLSEQVKQELSKYFSIFKKLDLLRVMKIKLADLEHIEHLFKEAMKMDREMDITLKKFITITMWGQEDINFDLYICGLGDNAEHKFVRIICEDERLKIYL